ncbi:substrate-binding domain-containing protein [Curtobacterium sp. ISL-83]|uniref:substrate-binding domain-containing protein n=1 Tax=Curtobacterium sp. ISL-83 TaxID=2819145 RepID=UPI001BEAA891|nr:substrate-binding domain-containing protein [Curtobacterium sp. ISL-83]MBT2502929.1 substrate-binding domain-containing protein [Curtobacterium sp. ISL-83]
MPRIAVAAVALTAALALTGCQGATTAAPTPVSSSTGTQSDGGFARHAEVGVVLLAAAATPGPSSGGVALPDRFRKDLTSAGFRPDVRVASASDPAADQRSAVRALVRSGAKVLLVEAADPAALTGALQTARDAGVVVVAIGDPLPGSGSGGTGVGPDYRVQGTDSDAALVGRAVAVVASLQRGEQPERG